ncbi:Diacylglycerol kinase [Leucobacter aridicollis]|uniref:diacylglycerol/lipid kinase family protein n=1 Tax=Leucobacter aridicollis TaxID=283878 RepID=UPI002169E807|nr:diacylglycerol kinase family protein [Leucobacter aridicollis]MCS3427307.1 diacylglycerol kinase (ATP) [Leucobacter aridicollis]
MRNDAPFGVVVNPRSAFGRGARVAGRVLAEFAAAGVPAIEISGVDAADCQAKVRAACRSGLRGLVLVGGDGLIGLVLQVAEARALPIGVVPAGSGNDFARQFALAHSPKAAVVRVLAAEAAPLAVDLGVVERPGEAEHWFAGGLSIGLDAAINRRANAIRLPLGPFRYHLALIVEILTLKHRRFSVRIGSSDRSFTGVLATVMNTRAIGGGIRLAPGASVHDGKLDLVEVTYGTKLRLLSVLGLLARARHEHLPEVTITRAERIRIDAGDEVAYSDGERVGTGPFEVRVAPGALRFLA